ncbi:peptidylprolyl isomerase [Pseudoclavibacter chungangensis]|uniref:Peptidyl-prolyl cis-trans isomerase n=1 Tax=Pseudoclavibacter chungangensis TaxID=587635 RepID=A0A7J5BZU7_9MICO|nr:FKBP-type peptidyl-prolyl cis-trans isomerase [Pseudoclavibacter chungangensis]KAB1660179.1 peptidylprolyl isomerase [Pseudoclavibacter chungangensis]NYJ66706.1 peptidylprolyl isomerase [Pseudoclavibacter chungangensis]
MTTTPTRLRALGATAAAIALLALTACAGSGSPAETAAAPVNLKAAGTSGVLANVLVSDDVGSAPQVTVGELNGLGDEVEYATTVEGDGAAITPDDVLLIDLVVIDGQTKQEQTPYATLGQPITLSSPDTIPFFVDVFDGVPSGSRVVAVVPGAVLEPGSTSPVAPVVMVADVRTTPTVAWGTPAEPTQQLVQVSEGADGAPTVTIAEGAQAPTDLVLDTIRTGDGAVVADGDSVVVQYTGLLFTDGTVFDTSWDRGLPSQFATGNVVDGFRQALVGQTEGSRVIAIVPPSLGYGEQEQTGIPAGSTLVFVVDVLAIA